MVSGPGTYIITAGTYRKQHFFSSDAKLDLLEGTLIEVTSELGWDVHAWAVFPNHYHLIGRSPEAGLGLERLTQLVHGRTALAVNRIDDLRGRKVWYRSWDTRLSYPASYLARLSYVHHNAVRHGLVKEPQDYRWCSAAWFERTAESAFYKTVMGMKTERIIVPDDF
jgi:putative transposase